MLLFVDANTPDAVIEQSGKQATQTFWIRLRNEGEKDSILTALQTHMLLARIITHPFLGTANVTLQDVNIGTVPNTKPGALAPRRCKGTEVKICTCAAIESNEACNGRHEPEHAGGRIFQYNGDLQFDTKTDEPSRHIHGFVA